MSMRDGMPEASKLAIHFGALGRPRFGFYHPAPGSWRGTGVVICGPIGTDQSRSERSLRHLAQSLAEAGFPSLRFDPYGTGDSGGDLASQEGSAELVQQWLEDVGLAARELKARSGAASLALVGLRL